MGINGIQQRPVIGVRYTPRNVILPQHSVEMNGNMCNEDRWNHQVAGLKNRRAANASQGASSILVTLVSTP